MKKLIVCLLMIFVSLPAMAAVVFSDDFTDGNRDGWYAVTNSSSLTLDASGGELSFTNISSNTSRAVVANFGDVTLSANEFIRLSFDGRAGSADESDDDFRFGLFNNQGTPLTADESSSGISDDDDTGYFVRGSTGTTLDVIDLVEDNGGTTILGGSAIGIQGSTVDTTTLLPWPAVVSSYLLEIRMNSTADTLLLDLWIDGVLVLSGDDVGGSVFTTTFNEVGFASNANPDFVIDNVVVETGVAVPEPATLSLLALGGFLLRKRRL